MRSIQNPDGHRPLIICGGTGNAKHIRAFELRDQRSVDSRDADCTPVVIRLDATHGLKHTLLAFANIAAAGYQVIGVHTGTEDGVRHLFKECAVIPPENLETMTVEGSILSGGRHVI